MSVESVVTNRLSACSTVVNSGLLILSGECRLGVEGIYCEHTTAGLYH